MCGIVGLFLKDPKLEPQLGAMLTDMLITMTDRGPDSAGIAIYSSAGKGLGKLTVQSAHPEKDFKDLDGDLKEAIGAPVAMPATLTPQEAVNRGLPRPSACDCVVVVLWARVGTPLPASCAWISRPPSARACPIRPWPARGCG